MTSDDLSVQMQKIGKGLMQVNLRLSRVLEAVQEPRAASTTGPWLGILLDLLEALDNDCYPPVGDRSFGWLKRWLGIQQRASPQVAAFARGIALARATALDRLAAEGIVPIEASGAFDSQQHRVIDTEPAGAPEQDGQIARVHRGGWLKRQGEQVTVLRSAHVTVYRIQGKQAS